MQPQAVKPPPGLAPNILAPSGLCQGECMMQKGGPQDSKMSRPSLVDMSIQEALASRLPEMPECALQPPCARQPSKVPSVSFHQAGCQSSQSQHTLQPPLSLQRIEQQPPVWPPISGQPSQDSAAVLPQEVCHAYTSADSKHFCSGSTATGRFGPMLFPSTIFDPVGGNSAMNATQSRNRQSYYCSSVTSEMSPSLLYTWQRAASSATQTAQLEPAPEFNTH